MSTTQPTSQTSTNCDGSPRAIWCARRGRLRDTSGSHGIHSRTLHSWEYSWGRTAAGDRPRHATRLAPLADQVCSLRGRWQDIAGVATTIENVGTMAHQLSGARATLAQLSCRSTSSLPRLGTHRTRSAKLTTRCTDSSYQMSECAPSTFKPALR